MRAISSSDLWQRTSESWSAARGKAAESFGAVGSKTADAVNNAGIAIQSRYRGYARQTDDDADDDDDARDAGDVAGRVPGAPPTPPEDKTATSTNVNGATAINDGKTDGDDRHVKEIGGVTNDNSVA